MKNFCHWTQSKMSTYADDTVVYFKGADCFFVFDLPLDQCVKLMMNM